jgi:hypothetical protein
MSKVAISYEEDSMVGNDEVQHICYAARLPSMATMGVAAKDGGAASEVKDGWEKKSHEPG